MKSNFAVRTTVAATVGLAGLVWTAPAASAVDNPNLPGFTYGDTTSVSYMHWNFSLWPTYTTWFDLKLWSMAAIGYQPTPAAGQPFYVHMNVTNVAVDPGNFNLILNPEASGLRVVTDGSLPITCRTGALDSPAAFPCSAPAADAGGRGTTFTPTTNLAPGQELDVQVPVVIDTAGTFAISTVSVSSTISDGQVIPDNKASVNVSVAAGSSAPAAGPATGPAAGPATGTGAPGDTRLVPTVNLKAVSGNGKILVDVDPNLPGKGSWTFQVQKLGADGATWTTWKKYATQKSKETRKVNPKKGTYRVVVLEGNGYQGAISGSVALTK